MTILDRYLMRELTNAWLTGLAVFAGFLMVGEVFSKGIELLFLLKAPVGDAVRWFLLALPNLIALSLPMATLLAVVMTIGRMSHDLEIVALLSAGISFHRLLLPVAGMAAGLSVFAFWLNAFVVPPTYGAADALLWRYRERSEGVSREILIAQPPNDPRIVLGARRFNPKSGELEGVWLLERMDRGERLYVEATSARWVGNRVEFRDGFVQRIAPLDKPIMRQHFARLSRLVPLRPPENFSGDSKQFAPNRLSLPALTVQIRLLQRWRVPREKIADYLVEWHNRFALSLSCLMLAMLGAPVALQLSRGGGIAVGVSVVFILLYYFAWNIGTLLAKAGSLPPFLGSHFANLLSLFGAILLLHRLR
jgi:lipopolysaccharide export system permease protein